MSEHLAIIFIGFNTLLGAMVLAIILSYVRPALFPWCMAGFLGLLVGYINLLTDATQFPVMLLLAFGFFMGYQTRKRVWLVPVLLAFWVPGGELLQLLFGTLHGPGTMPFGPLLAFVPAAIGTAVGGFLRYRTNPETRPS